MVEILKPKVEASGLLDVALLGVSKKETETALAPMVGNGTLKSGAVKLVAGGILQGQAGKIGKTIGGGLVVDGVEDLLVALMSGVGFGGLGGATGPGDEWA